MFYLLTSILMLRSPFLERNWCGDPKIPCHEEISLHTAGTHESLVFELLGFSILALYMHTHSCLRVFRVSRASCIRSPPSVRTRPSMNAQVAVVSGPSPGIKIIGNCAKFAKKVPVPDTVLKGKNYPNELVSKLETTWWENTHILLSRRRMR